MSETTESNPVQDLLDKPHEFDARAFINGASVAHEDVEVFTDGQTAWELTKLEAELAKAEALVESLSAGANGSIVPSEGFEEAEAEVEALKAREAELLEKVLASKMTFHVRGLGRKQVKLIDKKWRKAVKFPVRKHFENGDEGDEAFELEQFERNVERNEKIAYDLVASAIYKVTDFSGVEDTNPWSVDDVEALSGNLYDGEWFKLYNKVQEISFTETIFRAAVEREPDFLSKR